MKTIRIFIALIALIATVSIANSFTKTYTADVDLNTSKKVQKYEKVFIKCEPGANQCVLNCNYPNDQGKECSWFLAEWCEDCYGELFENAEGGYMQDHAIGQINTGTLSGSYSSNLVKNSTVFYRTVVWSADTSSGSAEINITITIDD